MKRINIYQILIFLHISTLYCFAQNSTFKWFGEFCTCWGSYDSTQISKEQLENTYNYLWWSYGLVTRATAWKESEISSLNIDSLKSEFDRKLKILKSNSFIDNPYWEKIRQERILEIQSIYELKKITILAYENPNKLKNHEPGYNLCKYYADALITGNHQVMIAWKKLFESRKNSTSKKNHIDFYNKYNSSDSLKYGKLELMMFGWWNCANSLIPYVKDEGYMSAEFAKTFKNVDCECDEP